MQKLGLQSACENSTFFWERINSKKDGGMSAIAFLFQNLFVAMTPSYDSILRRERYFNILSSPTITVSRAALYKYRFVQNHDSRCPRDARQRHRQPFSGRGKTDESANEAEPRSFPRKLLLPVYQRGDLEVTICHLEFVGWQSILTLRLYRAGDYRPCRFTQTLIRYRCVEDIAQNTCHFRVILFSNISDDNHFGLLLHFIKSSRVRTELNVHRYSLSAIPKVVSKTL